MAGTGAGERAGSAPRGARGGGEPNGGLAETLDHTRGRILRAAVAQIEELGLRRFTMEDVARRAGLGRATLYRHFQSKDALVQAVILAEAARFFGALDAAIADCRDTDERVVEGFAFALSYARRHALLHKLLRAEPEVLLPYLIGGGELIALATQAVAQRLHCDAEPSPEEVETAELLVRLVLSLALSPETRLPTAEHEGALRLARQHLVPALHARA